MAVSLNRVHAVSMQSHVIWWLHIIVVRWTAHVRTYGILQYSCSKTSVHLSCEQLPRSVFWPYRVSTRALCSQVYTWVDLARYLELGHASASVSHDAGTMCRRRRTFVAVEGGPNERSGRPSALHGRGGHSVLLQSWRNPSSNSWVSTDSTSNAHMPACIGPGAKCVHARAVTVTDVCS